MDVEFSQDGNTIRITCPSEEDAQRMMKLLFAVFTESGMASSLGTIQQHKETGEVIKTGIFDELPN